MPAFHIDLHKERRLSAVPAFVWVTLAVALTAQIVTHQLQPAPTANADALALPPSQITLHAIAGGDNMPLAQALTLRLQAYDNQPGMSIPFKDLDYARVIAWLDALLELDPNAAYPLLLASQVYSQVPDEERERAMLNFVHQKFIEDPNRRWRWLAHASLIARHRLHDNALALQYAKDITDLAPLAPGWARQMQIFILEDMGEAQSAKVLLGGLIVSGEIKDLHELHFLTEELHNLESGEKRAEKPTRPTKN